MSHVSKIEQAQRMHRPVSHLRRQHVAVVTEQIGREAELSDRIARDVTAITTALANLIEATGHDDDAYFLARRELDDLALAHARLGRLIEALRA